MAQKLYWILITSIYIGLTYVLRVRGGYLCQKTDAVRNQ